MALSPTSSRGSSSSSSAAVCHGPYTLAYNTPGLVNPPGNGIHFKTLTAGDLIVQIVVLGTGNAWNPGVNPTIVFELGDPANWETNASDLFNHVTLAINVSTGQEMYQLPQQTGPPELFGGAALLVAPAIALGAYVYTDSGTPTAGSSDVYVFTVTPTLA